MIGFVVAAVGLVLTWLSLAGMQLMFMTSPADNPFIWSAQVMLLIGSIGGTFVGIFMVVFGLIAVSD